MLATGLVATGTVQGSAAPMRAKYNVFETVGSGLSALLPTRTPWGVIFVTNKGANTLKIYPSPGYKIDSLSIDASTNLAAGATVRFASDGAGNWWTL